MGERAKAEPDIPLAQMTPPQPSLESPPANTSYFKPGDFFIALDDPTSRHWWLHRVLKVTGDKIITRIYGTRGISPRDAKFSPVFADHKADTLTLRLPRGRHNFKPWTQTFLPHHLAQDIKVVHVQLLATGRLSKRTYAVLRDLPGGIVHAVLKRDMSDVLTLTYRNWRPPAGYWCGRST